MASRSTDSVFPPLAPKCPICGTPARPETRPFCSDRCRDVDLHRWLSGQYAIPVVESDEAADGSGADQGDEGRDGVALKKH